MRPGSTAVRITTKGLTRVVPSASEGHVGVQTSNRARIVERSIVDVASLAFDPILLQLGKLTRDVLLILDCLRATIAVPG